VRRRSRRAEIVAIALAVSAMLPLAAQRSPLDDTQWRGAARDGSASGFVAPGTMPVLYKGTVIVSALDSGVVAFRPLKTADAWTVDGELIVTKSSRTGLEPLRRYVVATSATWAQPVISGQRFFIKDVTSIALWTLDAAVEARRP
jgi:hypothetical protein